MSIDASKWARAANVQKSSSKLVLLELAHLVRPFAAQWAAFASIEYLARVTHLNRKTVIEALARLRALGAIIDTGQRAGASRSCTVYRLCPAAVPLVYTAPTPTQMPTLVAAGSEPGQRSQLPHLAAAPSLQAQGALALEEGAGEGEADFGPAWVTGLDDDCGASDEPLASALQDLKDMKDLPAGTTDAVENDLPAVHVASAISAAAQPWVVDEAHAFRADIDAASVQAADVEADPVRVAAVAAVGAEIADFDLAGIDVASTLSTPAPILDPAEAQANPPAPPAPPVRVRLAKRARRGVGVKGALPAAGAGPTRLPANWTLPARWCAWTHRERPQWSPEKVQAMALTFTAYWRSKPGHAGYSEDWFESWRLWVFRERESGVKAVATPWSSTWSGIVAKGASLGLQQAPGEREPAFRIRVHQATGVPLPA